jgi:hypothetical protein
MSATFVIFGNVGNVTVVLRPSSDIKMMTEDSRSGGFLRRRWSHDAAPAEQHAHRGADFVVALTVNIIDGGKPVKIGMVSMSQTRMCGTSYRRFSSVKYKNSWFA